MVAKRLADVRHLVTTFAARAYRAVLSRRPINDLAEGSIDSTIVGGTDSSSTLVGLASACCRLPDSSMSYSSLVALASTSFAFIPNAAQEQKSRCPAGSC